MMIHNLGPSDQLSATPGHPAFSTPLRCPVIEASDANNLQVIQVERLNSLRVKYWTGAIIRVAFALGLAGIILAVFFSLILIYLRWVL